MEQIFMLFILKNLAIKKVLPFESKIAKNIENS